MATKKKYKSTRSQIPAEIRRVIEVEAGHACSVKGCNEHTYLEIHHINDNREDNSKDNLILLCDKHHKMAHRKVIDRKALRDYKRILDELRPRIIKRDRFNLKDVTRISIPIHDRFKSEEIDEAWNQEYERSILILSNDLSAHTAEWTTLEQGGHVARFDDTNPEYIILSFVLEPITKLLVIREHHAIESYISGNKLPEAVQIRRQCWYRAIRDSGYTSWCAPNDAVELTPIETEYATERWEWVESLVTIADMKIEGDTPNSDDELEMAIVRLPTGGKVLQGDWELRALEIQQR